MKFFVERRTRLLQAEGGQYRYEGHHAAAGREGFARAVAGAGVTAGATGVDGDAVQGAALCGGRAARDRPANQERARRDGC